MTSSPATGIVGERQIVITRTFDAPRELVFEALLDPRHIDEWWGPTGFTTTTRSFEPRVGGTWRFVMRGPDGVEYPDYISYTEIVRPERLAYEHGDDDGPAFTVVIAFQDLAPGRTALTMTSTFPSRAARDRVVAEYGAIEGGSQTLARLAAYLEHASKS